MADVNNSGLSYPVTLAATIAANKFVLATGALCGADAMPYGVTTMGGASTDIVNVQKRGCIYVTSGGAISSVGTEVSSDASGRAVTRSTQTNVPGVALTTCTGADENVLVDLDARRSYPIPAAGTVTTAMIVDEAITTPKIADDSVTSAKIVADTITAADIAANAITDSELADNAVDTAAIQDGAVTPVKQST